MHVAVKQAQKTSSGKSSDASIFPSGYMLTFLLTTLIFFVWGMSNNLTDILVQQFKKSFELNVVQAQLVQTAVFLAYFVMAMPAALLMRRFGYKMGLVVGLVTFAITGIMARSTYNDLNGACQGGPCPTDKTGELSSGKTQETVANVALVVGIAGVAAGTTLFVLSLSKSTPGAPAAGLAVSPGWMGVRGSW